MALSINGAQPAAPQTGGEGDGDKPNVLIFMTDDQRQDAMGAYGNAILRTPNMDRIAAEGVRFTEAFVTNALCAPSRASLLTGLYSHAHGVTTNAGGPAFYNQPGLPEDLPTFVHLLHRAGYHTVLVGKWHLRSPPAGFDEWVVFPGQGAYQDPVMIAGGTRLQMRGHADDVVGDQTLAALEQLPEDRPFCLLCQFKSPHRAWIPAPRFAHAFEDVEIPLPRTFEDRLAGRPEALRRAEMALADMPDFHERGVSADLPREERKRANLEHLVRNYYRVLLSVDDNVGRVLEALDAAGLAQNTVVVYTSDNGFFLGEHGLFDKRLMYEPSIRVPLLVRFPARLRPRVDSTHMTLNVDVAPTLLELAGVPPPERMQGRSLVPLLEGASPSWRDAFLYEYFEYPAEHCVRKNRGVRTARWKLIHFWEQPEEWELYDLLQDPDETENLAGRRRYADEMRSLQRRLEELRRELGDEDPPGPAPVAAPCGEGVNTGYGPPAGAVHAPFDSAAS
ncbi:MAG: sulfatase [Gemmatimonadota bacterium]